MNMTEYVIYAHTQAGHLRVGGGGRFVSSSSQEEIKNNVEISLLA